MAAWDGDTSEVSAKQTSGGDTGTGRRRGAVVPIAAIVAVLFAIAVGLAVGRLTSVRVGVTAGVAAAILLVALLIFLFNRENLKQALKPALVGPSDQQGRRLKVKLLLNGRDGMAEWLGQQRGSQLEMRWSLRLWRVIWLLATFFVVAGLWWTDRVLGVEVTAVDIGFAGFLAFASLAAFLFTRARLLEMNEDFQATDYELLILNLESERERTAAKLFFKHQFELKRYYDQNLRHNGQVFALGTLCVLVGLATVAGAAYFVVEAKEQALAVQLAVAALGAAGGVLAGAVAAIFIRMYVGTGEALREFHRRLVVTNRLHFANLLTATVSSRRRREKMTEDVIGAACVDGEPEKLQNYPSDEQT